jgi:hypothetical protein
MKRFSISVSAAIMASMFATVPLSAQPGYGGEQRYEGRRGSDWNRTEFWRGAPDGVWERISFLQRRIDRGIADRSLSRREAQSAQFQLRRIRQDAQRMRTRNGNFRPRDASVLQTRLDDLSRNLRWSRQTAWSGGDRDWSRYRTDYDARRYYREGPQYSERRLSAQDEVYRGSDGRYYCKRSDGTTGLIIGGVAGAGLGNVVDGGDNRLAGTLIGGALGALLGKEIDQNSSDVRCR